MIEVGWRSRGRGTVSGSARVGRFGVESGIVGVVFVRWGGAMRSRFRLKVLLVG